MTDTETTTRPEVLTRADRCIRCGHAAMVRVNTKNLGEFLWCGHDYDRNKDAIPGIIHVHDERQPLP